ncbi:hypothetical protein CRUP_004786, partial [Coryphaenoides rupestris]
MGSERYECDCTRTGYIGENCTNPEFFTWIKISLKPSPNTVHYILTHFKGFWNIVNNMSVLRDAIMRYVLTSVPYTCRSSITGKKELPDIKMLAEKLLARRQFVPDPQRSSLMFAFFAQHFTHQFFKSDMKMGPAFTRAKGHGMHYPPHVPTEQRFAVGHEAFGLVPGLIMYATIWLREHNRVCDVLKEVHPDWDDDRLFQTTRLILI